MPLTPEEIAKKIEDTGTNLGARIATNEDRLKALEDAAKKRATPVQDERGLSITGIVRGMLGNWEGFDREKAIYDRQPELKRTVLSTGVPATAGYVIPPEYSNKYIDLLTAKSVLSRAGMQTIKATGTPYSVPRISGGPVFAYTAETGSVGATNPTFEQPSATPHQFSGYVEITRLAAELSDPGLEGLVSNLLTTHAALFMDKYGMLGTGGSNQPTGIINDSDVNDTALNAALTIDHILDALARVEQNNGVVNPATVGIVMNAWCWNRLRKEKASTGGTYQLGKDKALGTPYSIEGIPVYISNQLPSITSSGVANETQVIVGDFSQLYQIVWGNLAVESSAHAGFLAHTLLIKLVGWHDFIVANPASFEVLTDVR